jgi:hypothetical protein
MIIKRKVYEIASEGEHDVTITAVKDKGVTKTKYGDKDLMTVTFRMDDQIGKDGQPIVLHMNYTKLIEPKAALTRLLLGFGIPMTDALDTDDLIDKSSVVTILHRDDRHGKTQANVVFPKVKRQQAYEVEVA